MTIALVDPGAFFRLHREALQATIMRVTDSGQYILGAEVDAFEKAYAEFVGVDHAVGVASGTDALILALRAAGVRPGDRVATVSHTATATASAIQAVGAKIVWIDIDPKRYTMCPTSLDDALSWYSPVKAVVVVHLYGQPADLPAVQEVAQAHGALLIEDCAQAHGASLHGVGVGRTGALAAFSFYPTKNLGALGDGGAVTTADPVLDARLRALRQYGWHERHVSGEPGMNSRLDELQAAVLSLRLPHLSADNARRREIAMHYRGGLYRHGAILPVERTGAEHVYHQFVIRHAQRDRLRAELAEQGIGAGIHYPVPCHRQPGCGQDGQLPPAGLLHTERAAREVLSLPMYAELPEAGVQRVIDALSRALEERP